MNREARLEGDRLVFRGKETLCALESDVGAVQGCAAFFEPPHIERHEFPNDKPSIHLSVLREAGRQRHQILSDLWDAHRSRARQ